MEQTTLIGPKFRILSISLCSTLGLRLTYKLYCNLHHLIISHNSSPKAIKDVRTMKKGGGEVLLGEGHRTDEHHLCSDSDACHRTILINRAAAIERGISSYICACYDSPNLQLQIRFGKHTLSVSPGHKEDKNISDYLFRCSFIKLHLLNSPHSKIPEDRRLHRFFFNYHSLFLRNVLLRQKIRYIEI